jgi:hypothetical protein
MGHWGPGILEDDVAVDVRVAFEDALSEGLSISEATQRVLDDPPAGFDDEEDAAVTYLALAALQLEHGALEAAIRDKAIAFIESGIPLWRWEGSPPERIAERQKALEDFKARLLHRKAEG